MVLYHLSDSTISHSRFSLLAPEETRIDQVKVVTTMLKAGILNGIIWIVADICFTSISQQCGHENYQYSVQQLFRCRLLQPHIRKNMKTPTLDKFFKRCVQLFSHSPKTRLIWECRLVFLCDPIHPHGWELIWGDKPLAFVDVTTFWYSQWPTNYLNKNQHWKAIFN